MPTSLCTQRYAAGAQHPHKGPSVWPLESIAMGAVDAALEAEVLQEVLHRYCAIGRWTEGRQVYDDARRIFAGVLPVTADVVAHARHLLDQHQGISARAALRPAVVVVHGLEALCSYDTSFGPIGAIRRVSPADVLH